jgi:hypothetical protein
MPPRLTIEEVKETIEKKGRKERAPCDPYTK